MPKSHLRSKRNRPKRGKSAGPVELTLYIAGQTPKSLTAIANLKRICSNHLKGQYRVSIVDLVQNPELAQRHDVLAIPTLVRNLPRPIAKIIGDSSDTERILMGLNVQRS